MTKKSVVIFETTDETSLFLKEGDLRKFEGVLVNSVESDEDLANELAHINFDIGEEISTKMAAEHIKDGAYLVHCGFIY